MQGVTAPEVQRIIQRGQAVVIDVLSRDSYEEQHLPGAINLPVREPDFERRLQAEVPDKDAPIVFYCSGPSCEASPEASRRAEELGYRNVMEYRGGLKEWKEAGFAFERGPAERVAQRPG